MRGRNNNNSNSNNNRKGPNPLTRSYESNGPDVKIRGSAQQIAEKYATLARDAQSAGDRVVAENYLQHAEHYNRIIAAAQAQMPIQNVQRDDADDDMDDERDDFDAMPAQQPYSAQNRQGGGNNYGGGGGGQQHRGNGGAPEQNQPIHNQPSHNNGNRNPVNHAEAPQPVIEGVPAEIAFNAEAPVARPERNDGPRGDRRDRRRDRESRFDNRNGENDGRNGENSSRNGDNGAAAGEAAIAADAGSTGAASVAAPDIVATAEVSPAASAPAGEVEQDGAAAANGAGDGAARRGRRPRRTARSRTEGEDGAPASEQEPALDFAPNPAPVAET